MSTLKELCDKFVGCKSELVRKAADPQIKGNGDDTWKKNANQYRVTLTYQERVYAFDWWQGIGISKEKKDYSGRVTRVPIPPTADGCLESLLLDASSDTESFADWCGGYGYDTDSRKALETYLATQEQGAAVRRLLGKDFAEFVEAAQS